MKKFFHIPAVVLLGVLTLFLGALPAHADLGPPDLQTMMDLAINYHWAQAFGWDTNDNPAPTIGANWPGVTADNGRINTIVGNGNGSISLTNFPLEISNLTALVNFNWRSNAFTVPIPASQFAGLTSLSSLTKIRLDENPAIVGTISEMFPNGFASLPNLGTLFLDDTGLSGPIPADLTAKFGSSTIIRLSLCQFSGALPATGSSNMNVNLCGNQLSGVLPDWMVNAQTEVPHGVVLDYNMFDVVDTPHGNIDNLDPTWRSTQTVPPTDVTVTNDAPGQATLTWTPIAYTNDGGYYEVLSAQTSGGPYTSRGTTAGSGAKMASGLTVSGLPPGTNYFVVRTFTPAHTNDLYLVPPVTPDDDYRDNLNNLTSVDSAEVSASIAETPSLVVTTTNDVVDPYDGQTSLREAAAYAATLTGPQTITFAPALSGQTILLTNGQITLSAMVTIDGSALPNGIQINANWQSRLFTVNSGATVVLNALTLTNGYVFGGNGGAISNNGTLTINRCALVGNGLGAALTSPELGGAIYNLGTLILSNSTVAGNVTGAHSGNYGGNGGGIYNAGTLTAVNCTLANNTAIYNGASGPILSGLGGGIYNVGTLNLANTIVANNSADLGNPDVSGSVVSKGYNLIGNTSGSSGWVASDLQNVNPLLGPLQNNGGPTLTMALLPGSPAIDAGNNALAAGLTTDQRGLGFPRVFNGTVDIGAFEYQGAAPQITSANHAGFVTGSAGTFTVTATGFPTPGLTESNALPNGVTFTDNHNGTATIAGTPAQGTRGVYSLVLTASNAVAPDAIQNFTLTVSNAPPVAPDQTYTRAPGLSLKIPIAEVLSNCSDPDGDTLTLDGLGASAQGATISTNSGVIIYLPANNNNNDSFSYTVDDGHGGVATGAIHIQVVNPGGLAQSVSTSGGTVTVNFAGIPGFTYDIERATSLAGPWTVLHTQIAPANGLFHYTDESPPSPTAYYRLQSGNGG